MARFNSGDGNIEIEVEVETTVTVNIEVESDVTEGGISILVNGEHALDIDIEEVLDALSLDATLRLLAGKLEGESGMSRIAEERKALLQTMERELGAAKARANDLEVERQGLIEELDQTKKELTLSKVMYACTETGQAIEALAAFTNSHPVELS